MEHDTAAALLDGQGRVVAAIEEGKLGRSRGIDGIPRTAIRFCLERAKIGWQEVGKVAVACQPSRSFARKAMFRTRLAPWAPISSAYYLNKALGELGRELNNLRILREMAGGAAERVKCFDHHQCHAASGYFASAFEKALIVSMDNQGDGRAGLVAIGEGTQVRELERIPFPHSLAWLYTQVTQLLGFGWHQDEHKTQWLSLTGDPVFAASFVEMLRRAPRGKPYLNARYFKHDYAGKLSFSENFYRKLGLPAAGAQGTPELSVETRANLASSLQRAMEQVLAEWLEELRGTTGTKNLCLAGGLFLNPLLVAALERNTGFDQIAVQPAAGNEGTALGAAWLAWHETPGNTRVSPMKNLYWGPTYSNAEIKQVLDNCKAPYRWFDSEDRQIDETVQLLLAGKIVAWFQGAAEFGPRALGHRSLFASPYAEYVQENLNDYVKHRESFRPFALAIPEENCAEYFESTANARFMTTMGKAKETTLKLLGGLGSSFVSKDGLTRLQVVTSESNPLQWKLLKRMGEKGPAPMLVNTSFNLFGEPLVITPRDAVRSYYCSGVDALFAGSFLLTKR